MYKAQAVGDGVDLGWEDLAQLFLDLVDAAL